MDARHAVSRCWWLPVLLAGCYHAQPLDDRAVLAELQSRTLAQALKETPGLQALPPDTRELGVEDAVAVALHWNPALRVFRRERDVAEGSLVTASTIANPFVRLDGQVGISGPGLGLGLQWEPPQPVEFAAKKALARARVKEVLAEIAEQEWDVAIRVRQAHARLRAQSERMTLLREARETRERMVALVERRVSQGASTRLDLTLAQLSVSQLSQEQQDVASDHAVLLQRFQALLGLGMDPPVQPRLEDTPVPAQEAPGISRLEERALSTRPLLAAAHARYEQREQLLKIEHVHRWPWLRLGGKPSISWDKGGVPGGDVEASLGIPLPIFDWNMGPIKQAEAARTREREAFVAAVADVRRDIQGARADVTAQQQAWQLFQHQAAPLLEQHEKLMELALRHGQLDAVAWLAADEHVLRHRLEGNSLRWKHQEAWLSLARAVGPAGLEQP